MRPCAKRRARWTRARATGLALLLGLCALSCAKAEREAAPPSPAKASPPADSPLASEAPPPAAEAPPAPATPSQDEEEKREKSKDALKSAEADTRAPQTIAEAEAALAKAKGELDTVLAGAKPGRAAATPLATGDARCDSACRAFASLRRAADAVCRLAGEADKRCAKARELVKQNEARVSACNCTTADD